MPALRLPGSVPPQLVLALLVSLPGAYLGAAAYLGLPGPHLAAPLAALVYGIAVVGAAFILSWAAEAAQVDINAGLALAVLALLAILPEYAVDFVFTYQCGSAYPGGDAGSAPEVCSLALANMTGANRVLIGVGWPLVVLVATLAVWQGRRTARRSGDADATSGAGADGSSAAESASTRAGDVRLAPTMSVELAFLGIATAYSLTLPLKSTLSLWDSLVFVAIFAAYAWRLAQLPPSEPDLLGVSAWVGDLPKAGRRIMVAAMFAVAALMILLSAEHFAHGLVETGDQLGISKFLLVQWVAPLASEAPELLVACLYAWRLKAADSLGTLLSSKVNQWTLLVGSLPIVFGLTALTTSGLPLDTEQRYELLITAAQSLFAVAVLIDLRLTFRGALGLLSLFLVQFAVSVFGTSEANRVTIVVLSVVYALLAVGRFVQRRQHVAGVLRAGIVMPLDRLSDDPADSAVGRA
jgi:cation:H+ antiporter